MKCRLSTDNINDLKTLLLNKGIAPKVSKKVIDEITSYSRSLSSFRDILRWFNKSLRDEGLEFSYNFETHPCSPNGATGLFYVGKVKLFSADLILGFDDHSREWVIGDIDAWRKATQKAAFEDNWKRWIALDFIGEINRAFSTEIAEDMTEIRRLFDCASRKARYTCPKIEPEEDCYCPVEIIVQALDHTDLP